MKSSIRLCLLLLAICVALAIAYLGFNPSAVRAARKPALARGFLQTDRRVGPPIATVDASIFSVQVVSLETAPTGIGMQLTIRNTSTRGIAEVHAYLDQLLVGKCFWGIENDPIPPGGSATLQYNYEPAPHTIKIAAAVFEDGTGEGDQRVLDDAFTFSKAYRQQLRRNIDLLSEFIKSGELSRNSTVREGLAKLRQQMEAEPASSAGNEETDPFEVQGRHASTVWITMPVKHWESLASAQANGSSLAHAAARLQNVMSQFMDKCLALDNRLAERTAKRSMR